MSTSPFPDHDYEFESIACGMVETPTRDDRETLKIEPISITNDKYSWGFFTQRGLVHAGFFPIG